MKKILFLPVIALGLAAVSCAGGQKPAAHETKVIAHRGYWKAEGAAQNSLASLRAAAQAGCWGSEFDVHLTADGVAIINHDNDWAGPLIQDLPASFFADKTLSNGEILPTLEQYLAEGAKYPQLKLICEIKTANNPEHETRTVETVLEMVARMGLGGQVEYISFSYHICKEILAREPSALVAYLGGDKTVDELVADGIPGLDYHFSQARRDPDLFQEARDAGLYTNFWTVNQEDDIRFVVSGGADYLTTDDPELAMAVIADNVE